MSTRTHGTCSICGGPVVTPLTWMGIHPPTPTCAHCGAVPKTAHGPVIDMQPAARGRVVRNSFDDKPTIGVTVGDTARHFDIPWEGRS